MIAAISEFTGLSLLWTKISATVVLVLSVFGIGAAFVTSHDNKVIALHEAKIDKATSNATHTLRASGARSSDPGVRGIIDPTTKE